MYAWRKMTALQREDALHARQLRRMPFHGPPHYGSDVPCVYHLTAACFEHRPILGKSPLRMAAFEKDLVEVLGGISFVVPPSGAMEAGVASEVAVDPAKAGTTGGIPAKAGTTNGIPAKAGTTSVGNALVLYWCVLPNHWHALVRTDALRVVVQRVGRLHGRTSHLWNGEDGVRGRTCWHRCADRRMRSEAHTHATVNYILNNPVHHGYADRWQDWPYSNARDYLERVGEEEAARRWRHYPVKDYGKGWDDAQL